MKNKKIAGLAAFLITLIIMQVSAAIPVNAAPKYNLSYSFTDYLRTGTNTSVPGQSSAGFPDNTATLKWRMTKQDGSNLDTGTYMLSYPVADDVYAQFYLTKNLQNYTAKYVLTKPNTSVAPSTENLTQYPVSAADDYLIYTGKTAMPNFVPVEAFPGTGQEFSVERESGTNVPVFTFAPGYGFSFTYKGVLVHFKISTAGEFVYTTSGVELGKVYDFNLNLKQGASFLSSAAETAVICNGVSRFDSVTKASTTKTASDPINLKGSPAEKTADSENRVNISFDIPKIWVNDKFVTDTVAAKTRYGKIPVLISMDATTTERYQLLISSVFDVDYTAEDSSGDLLTRVNAPGGITYKTIGSQKTPYIDALTSKMILEIGDLPPGLIYNNVKVGFDTSLRTNVGFRGKDVKYGTVYTFLKYDIVVLKDRYYAVVQPYKGVQGNYTLYFNADKAAEVFSNGSGEIYLPLTLVPTVPASGRFQIEFKPDSSGSSMSIYSQQANFKTDVADISVNTPNRFDVVNYTLKARDEIQFPLSYKNVADLTLDLRWDITSLSILQKLLGTKASMTVTYNLYSTMLPNSFEKDMKIVGAVKLTITKVGSGTQPGDYTIKYEPVGSVPLFLDSDPNGEFAQTRDFTKPNDILYLSDVDEYTMRAYIRLKYEAVQKDAVNPVTTQPIHFNYPGIYFLSAKPEKIQYAGEPAADLVAAPSLPDSITLNDVSKLEVPPPQLFNITDNVNSGTEVSMRVNWAAPISQINAYMESSPKYEENKYGYELFICSDQTALKSFSDAVSANAKTSAAAYEALAGASCYTFDFDYAVAATFDISASEATNGAGLHDNVRNLLRLGKIVRLKNLPIAYASALQAIFDKGDSVSLGIKITGLDKNQQYYYTSGLSVAFLEGGNVKRTEHSKLTGIIGETTQGDKETPSPEERFPAAPVLSKKDVGLGSATVTWPKVSETYADPTVDVKISYEMIRTKDTPVPTALLNSRSNFSSFFSALYMPDRLGFFLNPADVLKLTSPGGGIFAAGAQFTVNYGDTVSFRDDSLSPNNLYFYYVRTVKQVNGKTVYSVWSAISVTTKPVQNPINLKYERTRTDFDKKTEAIISFDAPVPLPIYNSGTGTVSGYSFLYSVKLDTGDWSSPIKMNSAQLAASYTNSAETGYYHFVYKLTGLLPGKTYFVRVALRDANGDMSVYSNTAEIRTELDQEDYDKDRLNDDWLDFLKQNLDNIAKESIWSAYTSRGQISSFIYRPVAFQGLIGQTLDSALVMPAADSAVIEYFIPASCLKQAQTAGKSFVVTIGGIEFTIPANAINLNYNDSVLKMDDRIKAGTAKDYYLRITFRKLTASSAINGYNALTNQVTVSCDIAGSLKTTEAFDKAVYDELIALVAEKTSAPAVQEELKALLAKGRENTELVKYIDTVIASTKAEMSARTAEMKNSVLGVTFAAAPDKAMILKYKAADPGTTIKGFTIQGSLWTELQTYDAGNGKALSSDKPGTFIFAGGKLYIPALDGMPNSADITALIAKYNLGAILGTDFSAATPATYYKFAACIARISGASATDDPFEYLKSKGLTVASYKSQSPITKQEALYLLMGLYEIKTGTKISTLAITDYSLTSSFTDIDSKYLKSVQAAYQLKLFTDKNFKAKSSVTVGELLQMLANLNKKVKM